MAGISVVTPKNVRRMRTKLEGSSVPIGLDGPKTVAFYDEFASQLNHSINTNNYTPTTGHGYLGYPKKDGCTRFVPILTTSDTIVYYSIVWAIEDELIKPLDGIYGAWHTKPEKILLGQAGALQGGEIDQYSSNTFNKLAWFKQWASYADLLSAILNDKKFGNYVLTTDIANFYDTIDVGRLCDGIRSEVVTEKAEIVTLLRYFLQYWDRRVRGYAPSSKGIPQELISDASRTLANFYLYDFDLEFKAICAQRGAAYVRWADDIVIIGKSRKSLERALHEGSRELLKIGLNFNAAKTHHYTRKEYYDYRGLAVLDVVNTATVAGFEKVVKAFVASHKVGGGRMDSVFRACVTKLYKHPAYRTPYLLNFVVDKADDYYLIGGLSELQLFRFCAIQPKPHAALKKVAALVSRYPYASAKAVLMESIRKRRKDYEKAGVKLTQLKSISQMLLAESYDSEILTSICHPVLDAAL